VCFSLYVYVSKCVCVSQCVCVSHCVNGFVAGAPRNDAASGEELDRIEIQFSRISYSNKRFSKGLK